MVGIWTSVQRPIFSGTMSVTVRPIEEIGVACGFTNLRTFDRVFAEQCGCTPREYRRNAVPMDRI